ncbi:MAG: HAMP domain-containing histidine kinase [Bacilli bacterium]|nr:HAMP domain-containing histidine kinase [Bacilli bacterium]
MKFFQLYRKEFLSFFFCFCFFCLVSLGLSHLLIEHYKESFLENQAFLIHGLLEQHPELESEIVHILQDPPQDYDSEFLEKYGFTKLERLSYLEYVSSLESFTHRAIFFSFLCCFFLFLLLVLFFAYQKHHRILDINDYLFRVLQNDYQMNLKDYREDSISILKNDLLKVTNKLRNMSEISINDKKNLERTLSDISHQLRTPLTSLTIINDVLSSDHVTKSDEKKFLIQQREQLERMEWLIVTLLKMSQIDSGTIVFEEKEESVLEMINEAIKPSLIPLELKQIEYEISIDPSLKCVMDFHWMVEAFVNLIKNAMEHTQNMGHLKITASDNPMFVEIKIIDDGIGISKKDLPHIFERFYKCNTKAESIGIGLNFSKTVIEKQHGVISVSSVLGKGTTFVIRFLKMTI